MKMSRRKLRETIFLLLFRIEFNSREELLEQEDEYFADRPEIEEPDQVYIRNKLNDILSQLAECNAKIMEICDGWKITRLGKTELSILRLAVFEILKDEDIPVGVAINEAVELARIYCSEEAPRFVNGVLAKLAS